METRHIKYKGFYLVNEEEYKKVFALFNSSSFLNSYRLEEDFKIWRRKIIAEHMFNDPDVEYEEIKYDDEELLKLNKLRMVAINESRNKPEINMFDAGDQIWYKPSFGSPQPEDYPIEQTGYRKRYKGEIKKRQKDYTYIVRIGKELFRNVLPQELSKREVKPTVDTSDIPQKYKDMSTKELIGIVKSYRPGSWRYYSGGGSQKEYNYVKAVLETREHIETDKKKLKKIRQEAAKSKEKKRR
jgi:hypothetical protein